MPGFQQGTSQLDRHQVHPFRPAQRHLQIRLPDQREGAPLHSRRLRSLALQCSVRRYFRAHGRSLVAPQSRRRRQPDQHLFADLHQRIQLLGEFGRQRQHRFRQLLHRLPAQHLRTELPVYLSRHQDRAGESAQHPHPGTYDARCRSVSGLLVRLRLWLDQHHHEGASGPTPSSGALTSSTPARTISFRRPPPAPAPPSIRTAISRSTIPAELPTPPDSRIANAILGNFDTYAEFGAKAYTPWVSTALDLFAQDSWKATSKLNVEYGVRWSLWPPWHSKWGNLAEFLPQYYNPAERAGGRSEGRLHRERRSVRRHRAARATSVPEGRRRPHSRARQRPVQAACITGFPDGLAADAVEGLPAAPRRRLCDHAENGRAGGRRRVRQPHRHQSRHGARRQRPAAAAGIRGERLCG